MSSSPNARADPFIGSLPRVPPPAFRPRLGTAVASGPLKSRPGETKPMTWVSVAPFGLHANSTRSIL